MKLFEIGFLTLRIFDVIDILLAALLIYALFKIIRGSIALNIFIGILVIYIFWLIVKALNMKLMSSVLGQFISVGVIALLIVFQQEVRRFLLMLGRNRLVLAGDRPLSWRMILPWNWQPPQSTEINFEEIATACLALSKNLTGALIVLARTSELKFFASTGIQLDSEITGKLLETIFHKRSPIHDGAVIIIKNRIKAASCILPVSESENLPPEFGLRHRSALGIVEQTDAMAIIVSEETGRISIASKGEISPDISSDEELGKRLFEAYYQVSLSVE